MHADAVAEPSAASAALSRACLRHGFHAKFLNPCARVVAAQADESGIHHETDAGDRQRGFRDVGCEDDSPHGAGREYFLLVAAAETPEKRQDFRMLVRAPRQHFGTVADLPFAGKENQNVAARIQLRQEFHAARHALRQFFVFLRFEETVFDGKHAPFDFDDRSIGKEPGNAFRVQCGGSDDDPQVFPAGKQKFHVSEQEVDIQRAFMDFVEDDTVVLKQVGIVARFGKQNAVRHELDDCLTVGMIVETDFVADFSPALAAGFTCHAPRQRGCRNPARLGASDASGAPESVSERDLRKLGRFPRPRGAADNHRLVLFQGFGNLLCFCGDRQFFREFTGQGVCKTVQ